MGSKEEFTCVYSALLLADDDAAITAEKIQTILKSASVDVEPYWPGLFANALEGISVKDSITNVGSGVGGNGPAPAGAPVTVAVTESVPVAKKEEAKKKEESEESYDDMGFSLFR